MQMDVIKELFLSPLGFFLGLLVKALISAYFGCIGLNYVGYKSIAKRSHQVLGAFLMIIALKLAILVIFSNF